MKNNNTYKTYRIELPQTFFFLEAKSKKDALSYFIKLTKVVAQLSSFKVMITLPSLKVKQTDLPI